MKKRTISKLKSIFGSKKGKKQQEHQQSSKSSRATTPESLEPVSPIGNESFRPILRTPPPSRVGPPPSPPVPTSPIAPVAPEPSGPLPLSPCPVCGRTFVPASLAKHVKICEKMTVKKRKTFDSSRQRREGTDLEQYLPKNFGLPENSPFLEKSPPNTAKAAIKPKTHSVRSVITKPTADLQKCPHCHRAFGIRAFERHVEWCADKAKILPAAPAQPPPHIADAKQRLNARTQYKAPPVRGRRSSQTREKSSNSRSASVESTRGISPPREFGDYRHARTRASESMSSNDCHDDISPHMPVIRNSRAPQNSSSGDANVKARQARLARDLSSSRNIQESHTCSVQQTKTDPNVNKKDAQKPINRLNVKKRKQLKKLEEIANKYAEKNKNTQEKSNEKSYNKSVNKNEISSKSQIPVPKKVMLKEAKQIENELCSESKSDHSKNIHESNVQLSKPSPKTKTKEKQYSSKKIKESTMSLDSLDEPIDTKQRKNCQSVGINTELLCPCVPCVIHETDNTPLTKKQNNNIKFTANVVNLKYSKKDDLNQVVELLYKNPNMVSSCDIEIKKINEDINLNETESAKYFSKQSVTDTCKSFNDNQFCIKEDSVKITNAIENTVIPDVAESKQIILENSNDNISHLSIENIEENYEHDLSEENFEDSFDDKKNISNEEEDSKNRICRHGSGDTYTKFSEDPADLEEFLSLTDKMIDDHEKREAQKSDIEQCIENIHTPRTNSMESMIKDVADKKEIVSPRLKPLFSDTFEELKSNLKDILNVGSDETDIINNNKNVDANKKNCDMEHITVYGIKFYDREPTVISDSENELKLKLPSISENNKCTRKDVKKKSNIYKVNKKCKMLGQHKRSDSDYRTFIIKENQEEISDGVPPLKLPRIDNKRLDDNYDPFASAARQMKELMSSDTNIPKKSQSSKDLSRTLPSLRPSKEKISTSYRSDNTKMIKDTLNKTYQKTPTLQRMKSFGSSNNENSTNTFGGRCSSFRLNRNDKKPTPKLNTTFTKSSKENISTEKTYFSRTSNLNRSFSSYSNSTYSTPKLKDKIPKMSQSMHHGFQRNTIKQPLKLDKINKNEEKKDLVNLDAILAYDNTSMTDSSYIDPRLINENDNLPINVNTILNNPDMISSMESLLTTENLPAKFDSFNTVKNNHNEKNMSDSLYNNKVEKNNNHSNKTSPPSNFGSQYDKIMSSFEQSIASKTSVRDDDSLCEDFDIEEFMITFDEEVLKQKSEKRTYSSTTRVFPQSELCNGTETKVVNSPKIVNNSSNGLIPVNKSTSLIFSSNNIVGDKLFPSSVKRSTSLLDSIQKKSGPKLDSTKSRHKTDQLEQDLMQSLKDFDKFYESERVDNHTSNKEIVNNNKNLHNELKKKDLRRKKDQKMNKNDSITNGNHTPNGKSSNDSAYSSLNRISPSKLSLCNAKESNGANSLEQIPAGSDSGASHKDEVRSISSDEFLAMERSAELEEPISRTENIKELSAPSINDKHTLSRASSRQSPWKRQENLSSSSSESIHRRDPNPPRLSRFCHECGSKFPVETAKFCIECGVKRLLV
ncbi:unnamed protein product, partial [Brenthis ino]